MVCTKAIDGGGVYPRKFGVRLGSLSVFFRITFFVFLRIVCFVFGFLLSIAQCNKNNEAKQDKNTEDDEG